MALLSSFTRMNEHTPLLLLLLCISILEVWAHRLAGRAGLRSSILSETLHRVKGDQVFGEHIYATTRCIVYDYFLAVHNYFLAMHDYFLAVYNYFLAVYDYILAAHLHCEHLHGINF
jgi:steroid 5-alpha reductase family enzyme